MLTGSKRQIHKYWNRKAFENGKLVTISGQSFVVLKTE